jgi:indolepyruvate ferredoxin oxidoreductase
MSHVRLAPAADMLTTVRIAPGNANLILGCDLVVATSTPALSRAERGVTRAVVNADLLPTASFVINPDIDFEAGAMRDALNGRGHTRRSRHSRRHGAGDGVDG